MHNITCTTNVLNQTTIQRFSFYQQKISYCSGQASAIIFSLSSQRDPPGSLGDNMLQRCSQIRSQHVCYSLAEALFKSKRRSSGKTDGDPGGPEHEMGRSGGLDQQIVGEEIAWNGLDENPYLQTLALHRHATMLLKKDQHLFKMSNRMPRRKSNKWNR